MSHISTSPRRPWPRGLATLALALLVAAGPARGDEGTGTLVLSEILSHPAAGLEVSYATWFEVYNPDRKSVV